MASSISERSSLRATAAFGVAVAIVVAGGAASAAPDQATKDAAEAKLVTGVRFLKKGEYEQALAKFEEAYALLPSPLIAYDLGLAYLGLGRDAEAMEAFERFLAEAPGAPADKRSNAERYRDEVRGRVAVVEIEADVGEAEVAVDGRARGRGPLPRRLYLDPGPHRISVGRPGAERAQAITEAVVAVAGQRSTLSLRLAPPPTAVAAGARAAPAPASAADVERAPSPSPSPSPSAPMIAAAPESPARPAAGGATRWALGSAAVGAVALGAGLTFGLMARGRGEALSADADNHRAFDPATESSGLRDQRIETALVAVGAVAVATAVVLFALGRRSARAGERP